MLGTSPAKYVRNQQIMARCRAAKASGLKHTDARWREVVVEVSQRENASLQTACSYLPREMSGPSVVLRHFQSGGEWQRFLYTVLRLAALTLSVTVLTEVLRWFRGLVLASGRHRRAKLRPQPDREKLPLTIPRQLRGWTADPEQVTESAGAPPHFPHPAPPTAEAGVDAIRPERPYSFSWPE